MLDLIGSEIRKLQRCCREGDEPVRIARAGLRQPLVLDNNNLLSNLLYFSAKFETAPGAR